MSRCDDGGFVLDLFFIRTISVLHIYPVLVVCSSFACDLEGRKKSSLTRWEQCGMNMEEYR